MTYETPTITDLGSVADFTRADSWAVRFDGLLFHGSKPNPGGGGGGTPTS
jgi:hypothetical protein